MTLREAKAEIREFLRGRSDGKLIELLEAARKGEVQYFLPSFCLIGRCFGPVTAVCATSGPHWLHPVDQSFSRLGDTPYGLDNECLRQRRLIPLLLGEIRRRGVGRHVPAREVQHAR